MKYQKGGSSFEFFLWLIIVVSVVGLLIIGAVTTCVYQNEQIHQAKHAKETSTLIILEK